MPHPALPTLADAISLWIREGRHVTAEVRQYAERLDSYAQADPVLALLNPEEPEHETFAEMLLFPDEALHDRVDACLLPDTEGTHPPFLGNEDLVLLEALLTDAAPVCTVTQALPDGKGWEAAFAVPSSIMHALIKRLHLTVRIPTRLLACIARQMDAPRARRTRTRLRLSRLALDGACGQLVERFIRQYPSTDPAYEKTLAFWLHFLSSVPLHGTDAEHMEQAAQKALAKRHQRLCRALRQASDFAEKVQRFSMELMMMQGQVAPYVHEEEAREELRIMERTSLAVFGCPAAEPDGMREADYGTVDPADMLDVMQTLSLLDK